MQAIVGKTILKIEQGVEPYPDGQSGPSWIIITFTDGTSLHLTPQTDIYEAHWIETLYANQIGNPIDLD